MASFFSTHTLIKNKKISDKLCNRFRKRKFTALDPRPKNPTDPKDTNQEHWLGSLTLVTFCHLVKLDPAASLTPSISTPKKDLMLGHYIDIFLNVGMEEMKNRFYECFIFKNFN
jgi:hypothetical protein